MIGKKYFLFIIPLLLHSYDESILKKSKIDIFNISKDMASLKSSSKNHSLIATPFVSYQQNLSSQENSLGQEVKSSGGLGVILEQDIFRSGGLYFSLKKNYAQFELDLASLEAKKRKDVFDAYKLFVNIKKLDLSIDKQKLLINNKTMTLNALKNKQKRQLSGLAQMGNAIIELNTLQNALYSLESTKENLIVNLSILSDKPYTDIKLWRMDSNINQDMFMKNNNNIHISKLNTSLKKYNTKEIVSSYLPKASVFVNYADAPNSNLSYGLKVSWRLSTGVFSAVELSKLDALKSSLEAKATKEYEIKIFNSLKRDINIIESKIKNTKKTIVYRKKLSLDIKNKYKQGLSAKTDFVVINNTYRISKKDLEISLLEKHLKLIELYQRFGSYENR